MPSIIALHHISLSVTDLARSTRWYTAVLGFGVDAEIRGDTFRRTRLRHPEADITLTLTHHDGAATDIFDEATPGLDHLAFLVPTVADIADWQRRLEARHVEHSGIKQRPGNVVMITFRDPDNIQLEVMALGE